SARLALRGGGRRVHATAGGGRGGARGRAGRADHGRVRRVAGGAPRRGGAEHPASRDRGARRGRGASRGRPRRGGDAREAVCVRRGRQAGERDPGHDREGGGGGAVSTEDSLTRVEELLARLEAARAELEQLSQGEGGSPERALELLRELSELAKAVEEELERAKRAAEADAQS